MDPCYQAVLVDQVRRVVHGILEVLPVPEVPGVQLDPDSPVDPVDLVVLYNPVVLAVQVGQAVRVRPLRPCIQVRPAGLVVQSDPDFLAGPVVPVVPEARAVL